MYASLLEAIVYRWRRTLLILGVSCWLVVFSITFHILTSQQCYHVQVLGDGIDVPCKDDNDCKVLEGSTCLDSAQKCACPKGQYPSSDLSRCLPVAENYDSPCEDNVQCTARLNPGGVCIGNVCSCTEGFHYLHGFCWRNVGLNSSCSTSEQCYENSNYESLSCQAGQCLCSDGFYLRGGTHCRREGKAPGDECTFAMDCRYNDKATCVQNKCVGPADVIIPWLPDENAPTRSKGPKNLTISCKTSTDCSELGPYGECNTGGNCWCRHGTYMDTITNQCKLELGEKCSNATDCSHIKNAMCRPLEDDGEDGTCSCVVKYTPSQNNRECKVLRSFAKFCQYTYECLNAGPLAVCDNSLCSCQEGAHYEEEVNMCWASKGIGEECSDEKDCATESGVEGISCVKGKCECVQGYHEADGDCRSDSTELGQPCVEDLDCLFANSRCDGGTCGCQHGFFIQNDEDKLSCARGIEAPCNEEAGENCQADKSTCVNGTCSCFSKPGPDMVPSSDFSACLKVAEEISDACLESVQCQIVYGNNSECRNSICVCHENFHFRDQFCWPIRVLGEKCDRTSDCYLESDVERSECRNGLCECLYEYQQETTTVCSGGDLLSSSIVVLLVTTWTFALLK